MLWIGFILMSIMAMYLLRNFASWQGALVVIILLIGSFVALMARIAELTGFWY